MKLENIKNSSDEHAFLHEQIKCSKDADEAFCKLLEYSDENKASRGFAYIFGKTMLGNYFPMDDVEQSMYYMALFDKDDDDPRVSKKALWVVNQFNQKRCLSKFLLDLTETGVGALKTDDIIYLAHKCQKRGGKKYQVSVFVKGRGVTSDSTYDSPEKILEPCGLGANIPVTAKYLPQDAYEAVEQEYKVDSYWG